MPAALFASSVSLRATPLRAASRRVASKSAVRSAVVAPRAMASQDELKKLVSAALDSQPRSPVFRTGLLVPQRLTTHLHSIRAGWLQVR